MPAGEQPEAEPGGPGMSRYRDAAGNDPGRETGRSPGQCPPRSGPVGGFIESVRANGVLVALRIIPDGDGYRVIDGGRRLAAAVKAGVDEVPSTWSVSGQGMRLASTWT